MKLSEETAALWAALALAFAEMGAAAKTGRNPHFKSRYADSASVDAASRPALANNGIMVSQGVEEGLGGLALVTYLVHGASGQWVSQSVPFIVPRGKTEDPQAYGSALTYSRRYGLQAALGMVSEDDDGEAASVIARKQAESTEKASVERSRERMIEAVSQQEIDEEALDGFVLSQKGKRLHELSSQELGGLADWILGEPEAVRGAIEGFISEQKEHMGVLGAGPPDC